MNNESRPWPKVNQVNNNAKPWVKADAESNSQDCTTLEHKISEVAKSNARRKGKTIAQHCGQAPQQWPSAKVAEKKTEYPIVPVQTEYPIDDDVDVVTLVRVEFKKKEVAVIDNDVLPPVNSGGIQNSQWRALC